MLHFRAFLMPVELRLSPEGRFHLAENKRNPERPFAFMATYASRLSVIGRVQHLPLERALNDYAASSSACPTWWSPHKPPRPTVSVRLGESTPLRLGAEALLDFRAAVTLDGDPLSEEEVRSLLASAELDRRRFRRAGGGSRDRGRRYVGRRRTCRRLRRRSGAT